MGKAIVFKCKAFRQFKRQSIVLIFPEMKTAIRMKWLFTD